MVKYILMPEETIQKIRKGDIMEHFNSSEARV